MILFLAKLLLSRNPAMTLPYAKRLVTIGLVAIGLVLLVGGFLLWDHFDDKAAVEADRSASKAEAVSRARQADERAERAAQGTRATIEAQNRRAEEAAAQSEDPLKAGLDELRNRPR